MIENIDIENFITLNKSLPLVDVRSPVEFQNGHIPGSLNIPLFSDEERSLIGTTYKRDGQEKAIILGESFAEPKINQYLQQAENVSKNSELIVLCFRGGLRSQRFSKLLSDNGFHIYRLEKGYKSYRNLVQQSFTGKYPLQVLGGKTGCGKTDILIELNKQKEQVIDLEGLSNHRGSAFGSIGQFNQPTTEQFENELFENITRLDINKRIWVEDESLNIGRVYIPKDFYAQMKIAPLIVLEMERILRIDRLCNDYSTDGSGPLIDGIKKIHKRLGGERADEAIKDVESGDFHSAASIILEYYDKCYTYGLSKKVNRQIEYIKMDKDDPSLMAKQLIQSDIIYTQEVKQ